MKNGDKKKRKFKEKEIREGKDIKILKDFNSFIEIREDTVFGNVNRML